ncbi:MAG: phosphatase PAP2 family protein [Terriglobales bacterium]
MRAGTLAVLLLLLAPAARAITPWSAVRGTAGRLWHGTLGFPGAVVRDWRQAVPFVITTGLLIIFADAPLSQQIESPELERTSQRWSDRGLLEIEPAFTLAAVALEDRCLFCVRTGRFALAAVTTEAYTTASVAALKYSTGRERPYTPHDGDGGFNESGRSFPSGHSAGAFALAALLAGHDRQASWVNRIGYVLAGGVGAARFTAKEHFPSDIVVGAALGTLLGRCALQCPGN